MNDCKNCEHYAICREWYGSENGMPNFADDIECHHYEETHIERKRGRWIFDTADDTCNIMSAACSECGLYAYQAIGWCYTFDLKYCPNCGAKMGGNT